MEQATKPSLIIPTPATLSNAQEWKMQSETQIAKSVSASYI
jgi:hypothetical protein